MMKNAFCFILNALFVLKKEKSLTFCSHRRNGLIRKIRLISEFMTPQHVLKTIVINILSNVSRSKSNQAMKFGQLTREVFFFKNHAENDAGRLVTDLFLHFKKPLYEAKWNGLQLSFNIFG